MIHMAILGAGNIAQAMAKTVNGMVEAGNKDIALYAVASREEARAKEFADRFGIPMAYGSYEAMLSDPEVDLVYVATPHSHHAAHMKLCIEHGKAVLCEKSFTANAQQAEECLTLAKERGVLVTEAIWTRYMPYRKLLNDLIAEGVIGTPWVLTANLGYVIENIPRMHMPELAGGALLDLCVYPLNFAAMVFGEDIARMESSVQMMPTGVDRQETVTLHYTDGRMAVVTASAAAVMNRNGVVFGTEGYLAVDNLNNPSVIRVYANDRTDKPVRIIDMPPQITGYEYEVESCIRALQSGALECPEMPHAETLRIMRQMDALRTQWHMKFPFE